MKSSKKVLAFALAAAMVVTAVPATNAQAATTTAKLSATKVTVAAGTAKKQAKNIVVTIPSTWKSYKVTTSSSNKSVATARMCGKRTVKVTAVKKGSAKVTVKVTAKKSGKKVSKTLYANAKVIGAGLRFTSAPTDLAVGTEDKVVTKKCPSVAKVTYKSSDDAVATVDANDGTVKAIKAGKVTITATSDYGNIVTTDINVKKAILKSATQTEYNKIEAVIVGDTKDIKPSDITVTNTATKANVAVKSVSAKKGAENTFVIETFTSMTDAKEYSVVYADSTAVFTATNNTVAKVDLTKTEVPAGVKTEVKAVTKDANNIILGYFDLTNGNTSKGQVTTALTITKGYVQGTDVYLPTVGDTMAAKITYHTGSFASNGTETGVIENAATITAVDPSTINYNYAVTIGDSAPSWKAASFKANTAVKIGGPTNAYFRITDENGNDVADYSAYSVETADPTKLVVNAAKLSSSGVGSNAVIINGVSAGDTYILVKKDGKVVYSLPVQVQGKATATSVSLNKTSVTVMEKRKVVETIEAKLKDQYGNDMKIKEAKVENLAKPDDKATAAALTASVSGTKATIAVTGSAFNTYFGTYTYKVTLKDSDDKTVVNVFTVNFVKSAEVQSYQLSLPTEVDTTVTKDTTADTTITAKVVKMANGAAIDDYASTSDADTQVKYTVKDSAGKDVDSKYLDTASDSLTIKAVSSSAISSGKEYQKNLAAGTYYVTATFKVADANGVKNTVTVSSSFTIKDSQNTGANCNVKKNDLQNNYSVADAFTLTDFVEVTYDNLTQALDSNTIHKINSTAAGNTVTVASVEVFVKVTDSNNYVLITIPVNQTFVNVK